MKKGIILGIVLFVAVIVAGGIGAPAGGTVAAMTAEEATHWECWHPEPEPADPCGRIIYDIYMLATDDGWAVGRDELLLHWDGDVWTPFAGPAGTHLADVEMLSATQGWAVGDHDLYPEPTILHWDGSGWVEEDVPADVSRLGVVDVLAEDDAWAAGWEAGSGWLLRWDGDAWSEVTLPEGVYVTDIEMVSATDGWLAASSGPLRWNGSEFTPQPLPVADASIRDVEVVAADDVWANGRDGMWHWNGSEWSAISVPLAEDDTFDAVQMVTADEGWALNGGHSRSFVYRWNGSEWRLHSILNAAAVAGDARRI